MAVDIKEAIRRLIYEYTSKGADEVIATQEAVAASATKTDKASLSLEKSFNSLERRYVDTVRAQQDYQKVQERVNAAVAQNPELQERANVVLAAAGKHFDDVASGATKGSMAATVLARTLSRTIGPLALIGVAVAALSSAMEFMMPIAERVGADIYRRFSEAYPAAGRLAEEVSKAATEFIRLERAQQKVEAIAAALQGVASSAQLAALNIESMNQKLVKQRSMAEQAQQAERLANEMLRLAEIYPGVTLETAKQLELMNAQMAVAQARTEQERIVAQEILRQTELRLQGVKVDEAALLAAKERAVAEASVTEKLEESASTARELPPLEDAGEAIQRNVGYTNNWTGAMGRLRHQIGLVEEISNRLDLLDTQFEGESYTSIYDPLHLIRRKATMEKLYGAGNVEEMITPRGSVITQPSEEYLKQLTALDIGGLDVSSPAAIQQSFAKVLAVGFEQGLAPINRLLGVISDPATQASLVQQTINAIQSTQPPSLAREEMIQDLNSKLQGLISSTDSLNATMQNALSPFYSQDPRTTHLGFRAGVVGNPEWMVGGASNQNPLAAILGAGATAPGMANGGSFMVGGGYSANDNRIAAFPVASGEEVIVNRNRKGGQAGQVIHIDNRTIINGRVDADVFAQMKVSKYQQTQRMRAGLAVA